MVSVRAQQRAGVPESAEQRSLHQWRRQDFVTGGGVRYGSVGGLVRSPPEADTFTAVHREFVGFGTV